eukprot:Blabericola_migrator_1__844@NODE_1207_length_5107_cov_164_727183_g764_i1_p4_GENE_NODE_1207_length_5107_cov_164_727183_g764_i1NODE_1207_length_5107_cov_164_727183_g764_i1_p4_ORF_typecomplete_len204_score9_18UPF0016/PF01169_19/7_4e12DUF1624/PF07786_12/0_019DPM3/PF08285_11/0_091_NODE_1207_length_5107_cov_164_727183_g764_i114372048
MTLGSGASFWRGLAVSLVSTSISECGDRSFFTATILSIRYPRLITFAATYLALLVQSLTSTTVGSILQLVVPQKTHLPLIPIISAILFGAFAISYLREAILQHRAQQRVISRQSSVASRKENIVPREEWAARLLEKVKERAGFSAHTDITKTAGLPHTQNNTDVPHTHPFRTRSAHNHTAMNPHVGRRQHATPAGGDFRRCRF